ncbi:hypothetical protein RB213_000608 [Colletotrichum asianum]
MADYLRIHSTGVLSLYLCLLALLGGLSALTFAARNGILGWIPGWTTAELATLDLFQTNNRLELITASVPRAVLLGDPRFDWVIDDFGPLFASSDDQQNLTVPPPDQSCRSSHGLYVPEAYFVRDLAAALPMLCLHLGQIADHGPTSFRFTSGSSTQFRWATRGSSFLSPHDALPTIEPGFNPFPPESSEPTARPGSPYLIKDVDPGLVKLSENIHRLTGTLKTTNSRIKADLQNAWLARGSQRLRVAMSGQLKVQRAQMNSSYGGADRSRLARIRNALEKNGDWVRNAANVPLSTTVNIASSETTQPPVFRGNPGLKKKLQYDTAGVPEHFKSQWVKCMSARSQTSASIRPTASITRDEAFHDIQDRPLRRQFSQAQLFNQTAQDLLALLVRVVELRSADLDSLEKQHDDSRHGNDVIAYADLIDSTVAAVRELLDRASQVERSFPYHPGSGRYQVDISWLQSDISGVHKITPFLRHVALPRLVIMVRRARHGAELVQQATVLQSQLKSRIPTKATDWATSDFLFVFPHIRDLFSDNVFLDRWVGAAEEGVSNAVESLEAQFFVNLAASEKRFGKTAPSTIYSSLGPDDTREDPYGEDVKYWRSL